MFLFFRLIFRSIKFFIIFINDFQCSYIWEAFLKNLVELMKSFKIVINRRNAVGKITKILVITNNSWGREVFTFVICFWFATDLLSKASLQIFIRVLLYSLNTRSSYNWDLVAPILTISSVPRHLSEMVLNFGILLTIVGTEFLILSILKKSSLVILGDKNHSWNLKEGSLFPFLTLSDPAN